MLQLIQYTYSFPTAGQTRPCPRRAKVEWALSDALSNGTLLLQDGRLRAAGVVDVDASGCVDVAVTARGVTEGPFLQTCSRTAGRGDGPEGFVTECCGRREVIDPDAGECAEWAEGGAGAERSVSSCQSFGTKSIGSTLRNKAGMQCMLG